MREIAENLSINSDRIYQGRTKLIQKGELAFPRNGNQALTPDEQRIKDLEKQQREIKVERHILKKAKRTDFLGHLESTGKAKKINPFPMLKSRCPGNFFG